MLHSFTSLRYVQGNSRLQKIKARVDAAKLAGKVTPANEPFFRQLASKDMGMFDEFMKRTISGDDWR